MTKFHHHPFAAFSLSLLALMSMCLPQSTYAAVAGRFQFVAGDVRIVSADNKERAAIKGGEVHEKESILSGKTGAAQLHMVDDGIVAVRADTTLRIDEYRLASMDDGTERGFFSLLKGGFRSITGLIGKSHKDSYGIKTQSATIGIRGTDHETILVTTAQPGLPEGTYNKVNTGVTVVNGTLIGPNQVGYAPNLNTPAAILPHTPAIFDAPRSAQQGKDDRKRDSDKSEGKQQAKDEKQQSKDEKRQDAGQKPANGNAQPAPSPGTTIGGGGLVQPGTPIAPPPQNLISNTALMLPPTPSNPLPPPPITGGGTIAAPIGSGIVGGDISIRTEWNGTTNVTGPYAGGGGMVIEGPNQTILLDATTKLPVLVAEQDIYGNMKYSAGTAQMIDVGQTMVGTAKVVWGRYIGQDQFVDSQGTRDPITMNLMFTDQAMSFIQANTYFQSNSHTFNIVPGAGNVVDNLGTTYSSTGTLTVTATASPMVSLVINASNASRTWGLGYTGTVQQFYQSSCTTNPCGMSLTSASLAGATIIKGSAGGVFVGPNATGALTSYSANAFDATGALIGSLQGTSLFKR